MAENELDDKNKKQGVDDPEVQNELSAVATNPKQSMAIIAVIAVVLLYLVYSLFLSNIGQDKPKEVAPPKKIYTPEQEQEDITPQIPKLPEPPALADPVAPPPPPAPVEVKDDAAPPLPPMDDANAKAPIPVPIILGDKNADMLMDQRKDQKRKAAIVSFGGQSAGGKNPAQQVIYNAPNREYTLGRGKIIDAILETPINTDIGGDIRAIVSRDVYSQSGKVVLIPKGTRVFGSYSKGISEGGYGRVAVIWNRLDLPTGYIVNLEAYGTDNLGMAGLTGRVDEKHLERISNAVLLTAFDVISAKQMDKLVPPPADSQASTTLSTEAKAVRDAATLAYNTASGNNFPAGSGASICNAALGAITDKSSKAYTDLQTQCNSPAFIALAEPQQSQSAQQYVNTAADSMITQSATTSTKSKAQDGAEKGYKEISDAIRKALEPEEYKTTITIDQGKPLKIYVSKDYEFPKPALIKRRVMQ